MKRSSGLFGAHVADWGERETERERWEKAQQRVGRVPRVREKPHKRLPGGSQDGEGFGWSGGGCADLALFAAGAERAGTCKRLVLVDAGRRGFAPGSFVFCANHVSSASFRWLILFLPSGRCLVSMRTQRRAISRLERQVMQLLSLRQRSAVAKPSSLSYVCFFDLRP